LAENILNYDETNLTDDPGKYKVICRRGCKYPEKILNSSKVGISLMFAGFANGDMMPPFVVYKSTHLWDSWMKGGPEGTRYNRSKSGWFDGVCFLNWFNTIAFPILRRLEGKKVIIGDNLSCHLSVDVIKRCEANNISFVFLLPNSTHLLQVTN
jgi:hypothetical protein